MKIKLSGEPTPREADYVHYRTPKGTMLHDRPTLAAVKGTSNEARITCPECLSIIA